MDNRQAAAVLAACQWLKKKITAIESDAKRALELRAQETMTAELPYLDGKPAIVAKVGMSAGKRSVSVEDWDALADWLEERWPDSVKWAVDQQWWSKKVSEITKAGALYDSNGEVCPHLVVLEGDPYVFVKPNDMTDEVIIRLLREGGLQMNLSDEIPQLAIESTQKEEPTE